MTVATTGAEANSRAAAALHADGSGLGSTAPAGGGRDIVLHVNNRELARTVEPLVVSTLNDRGNINIGT